MKQFFLFLFFFFTVSLTFASEPVPHAPGELLIEKLETLITQIEFSTRMLKKRSDLSQKTISSLSNQKSASISELKEVLSELDQHLSSQSACDSETQENTQCKQMLSNMFEMLTQIKSSDELEICNEFMIVTDQLKGQILGYNRHTCCEDPNHHKLDEP